LQQQLRLVLVMVVLQTALCVLLRTPQAPTGRALRRHCGKMDWTLPAALAVSAATAATVAPS